jgi:hypothetical protein
VRRLALLESGVDLAVAKSGLAWSELVAIPNNRLRPRPPLSGMCLFRPHHRRLAQTSAQSLRVLLLEREASPDSGWLRLLFDHTDTGHRIASLLHPPELQRVSPLADIELRRQILDATLKKLGAKSELPQPGYGRRNRADRK